MRLTTVILIATLMQVSATGLAQKISLSKSNASLKSIFREIKSQSGYNFIYTDDQLEGAKTVTIKVKQVELEEVLKEIFKNQQLSYLIDSKTVIIKEKEKSFFEKAVDRFQAIDVRGRVMDEKGQPLAGATVTVRGKNRSVKTDQNGAFYLENVGENDKLVISYIGYQDKEADAASDMGSLTMVVANKDLEEVAVVSTGYQTLPKERATGSFVHLDEKTIERNVGPDLVSRLNGLTSSLSIDQRNGTGTTLLNIRGISTIFANDQPLIVVDNFPYNGNLNTINPNDIQNITVLRDAAAASIWGVRAGNGVIVITTKRGKSNAPLNVGFNSNITIGDRADLFYQPSISTSDLIDVQSNLFQKGYYDGVIDNNVENPAINPIVNILNQKRNDLITEQEAQIQIDALRNNDVRRDLEKYFYQKSLNQQYAVNFSGGGQKQTYYLSVGYDNARNAKIGDSNDRLSLNLQNTFNLTSKLSLDTRLVYTKTSSNAKNNENLFSGSLYQYTRLVDENGVPIPITHILRNEFAESAPSKGFLDWSYNPIQELGRQYFSNDQSNLRAAFGASYQILTGLSADFKYQYENESSDRILLNSEDSYYTRDLINRYSDFDGTKVTKRNIPLGAIREVFQDQMVSHNGRFQFNYNRSFLEQHRIDALAGVEIRETTSDGYTSRQYGFNPELGSFQTVNYANLYTLYPNMGQGYIPNSADLRRIDDRFRSYFANLAYTFSDKYTIYTSGRIDQSNLFGVRTNQRSAPLWSVGVKWDAKNDLFSTSKLISIFNLRTSYGYNGNIDQQTTAFTTARFGITSFSQTPMARLVSPPNPDLTWEKIRVLNLGLDYGFFENRISGKIEYYRKNGFDLIGNAYLDPTLGFPLFRGNVANIKGNGWDIELNSINTRGLLRWETNFFLNKISDKITDYKITQSVGAQLMNDFSISRLSSDYTPIVGRPLFGIYSFPWAGLDPMTGDPMIYLNGIPSKDYAAISQNYKLEDLNFHGRATPATSGALRNTVSYRGISFSVNLVYRLGYFFRDKSINYGTLYRSNNGHSDYVLRWRQPGDEKSTNVPSEVYPVNDQRDYYYYSSSVLVKKADNIRIQDIRLAYDLGNFKLGKAFFDSVEVYGYLNNVGLLWKAADSQIDPDNPYNAAQRSIAFGTRIKF